VEGNDHFDFSVAASLFEMFVECRNTKDVGLPGWRISRFKPREDELSIASLNRLSLFSYFVLRDYRLEVTLCNSKEIG
jgi:hypothetical protein